VIVVSDNFGQNLLGMSEISASVSIKNPEDLSEKMKRLLISPLSDASNATANLVFLFISEGQKVVDIKQDVIRLIAFILNFL